MKAAPMLRLDVIGRRAASTAQCAHLSTNYQKGGALKVGQTQSDTHGRSNIAIRDMATCRTCGLAFTLVDWLPWRTDCSKRCRPWRESPAGKDSAA